MVFRAGQDGTVVAPATVPNREPVSCLSCGGKMYARGGSEHSRHFYHVDESARNSCPGPATGESETHARCVALAVAALHDQFSAQASRCLPEVEIDVSMSGSPTQTRRADAVVEFDPENRYFGKGLIIEVQHRNHEKDARMTTHDYLAAGYSVCWLSSDAFDGEHLDYSLVNDEFHSENGEGYSARDYSPKRFISCLNYQYTGEHNWGTVPSYILTVEEDYEICTSPGCEIRRQYDDQQSEYVYDDDSITTPDLPVRVLRDAIIRKHPVTNFEESFTQTDHKAALEKALASRPEIRPCNGPKGFHEWRAPKPIRENISGQAVVALRACQHCSVHLLTDLRGYDEDRTDLFFSDEPDPEWSLLSLKADPRKCPHENRDKGSGYEYCLDCGVSNP